MAIAYHGVVHWRVIDWGGHIATIAVAHASAVCLVGWLLRQRHFAGERRAGATVMRYPSGWHVFAWTILLVPLGGLAFLAWRFPPKPGETIYLAGLVAAFGLVGGYMVVEVSGVAHEVQANGLLRHGPFRARRFLPWSQVISIRYNALASAWHLRTQSEDAWVPFQLSGIGAFAVAILDQVPAEIIDREAGTRAMLARLAAGMAGPGVTHP